MNVGNLITSAFAVALSRHEQLHLSWIRISSKIGSLLPDSLLMGSVQNVGQLDMLLRCMEDEFSSTDGEVDFQLHYQGMFSNIWIGSVYEFVSLLKTRKLLDHSPQFEALTHDLRLLRVPLEKHEIAADRKLAEPLTMKRLPPSTNNTDTYTYSKNSATRAHIMPFGLSSRGSMTWEVIDIISNTTRWIERRALSERIMELWAPKSSD